MMTTNYHFSNPGEEEETLVKLEVTSTQQDEFEAKGTEIRGRQVGGE